MHASGVCCASRLQDSGTADSNPAVNVFSHTVTATGSHAVQYGAARNMGVSQTALSPPWTRHLYNTAHETVFPTTVV